MSEMIERAARAIYLQMFPDCDEADWEVNADERVRECYRGCARAAIEAMREPTKEMAEAAFDVVFGEMGQSTKAKWAHGYSFALEKQCRGYQAMIDAALDPLPVSSQAAGDGR